MKQDIPTLEFIRRSYFKILKSWQKPSMHSFNRELHEVMHDMELFMQYHLYKTDLIPCECKKGYISCSPVHTANSDIIPFFILSCEACGKEVDISEKGLHEIQIPPLTNHLNIEDKEDLK